MDQQLTVSQFVEVINAVLQNLEGVTVVGEVDEYRVIHNKWVTFKLKDEAASVGCFMTVWQLRTVIENGMMVRAVGTPKLRAKGGFFSFVLSDVKPAGEGALKRAFELLQKKLAAEGLFTPDRKRSLPRFPQHIALITSRDAAAYSDFLKVLRARQGGLQVSFLHTQVQGDPAPAQIIRALEFANTGLVNVDAIVLVRGGGSMEDLSAFNDESVVRAVAGSRAPMVVGVGHERDVTLAELAADVRASTPSNAAELLVRTREEMGAEVNYLQESLSVALKEELRTREQRIINSGQALRRRLSLGQAAVAERISRLRRQGERMKHDVELARNENRNCQNRLKDAARKAVSEKQSGLAGILRLLTTLSPERTLKRGYSITRMRDGKLLKSVAQAQENQIVVTTLSDGRVESLVKSKLQISNVK